MQNGNGTKRLYSELLFIFPAATVVSHAGVVFANGVVLSDVILLATLMGYLLMEFTTTNYWERLEWLDTDNVNLSRARLAGKQVVEFLRVFALFMIYLTLMYTFADAKSVVQGMDILSQEKCLTISAGSFLVLNGLWNALVTPNSNLIHKDVEQFIQDLTIAKKKMFPVFIFMVFYYLQKFIFYFVLPSLGVAILITMTLEKAWTLGTICTANSALLTTLQTIFLPTCRSGEIATWIVGMLCVQTAFKAMQFSALELALDKQKSDSSKTTQTSL